MILFLSLGVIGAVAYAASREGLLTALTGLVNVLLSGLVAFNFFEPLAEQLESVFRGTMLDGFEDGTALFALFSITLAVLRVTTNNLASQELDLPAMVQQVSSIGVSVLTGYLLAGFLVCMVQTLPLNERFLGFDASVEPNVSGLRQVLPPDRVWLAMMNRAGRMPFSQEDASTFDPEGTFELRYAKGRRIKD